MGLGLDGYESGQSLSLLFNKISFNQVTTQHLRGFFVCIVDKNYYRVLLTVMNRTMYVCGIFLAALFGSAHTGPTFLPNTRIKNKPNNV